MRNFYKILALFCLVSASCPAEEAPALPAPITFIGQYSFSWGGIHLGKLAISIDEKPESYALRLAVTSGGVVNWFTRHESDTEVKGTRSHNHYQPLHYESYYKTKKKPRHIRLVYDAKGKNTEELNEPPEDRRFRPEVPANLKDGSYDPLTALLVLRSGVLTLPAFDAKRLYEVKAKDSGKDSMYILGTKTLTQHYTLARTPLAGMTAKEANEYKQGEPPLEFYFSDDARRVPVYITMPIFMGSVKGVLVKECKTWDECKVK